MYTYTCTSGHYPLYAFLGLLRYFSRQSKPVKNDSSDTQLALINLPALFAYVEAANSVASRNRAMMPCTAPNPSCPPRTHTSIPTVTLTVED